MARLQKSAFFFFVIGLFLKAYSVSAQTSTLPKGYYIVVASYLAGQEKFAQKYSAELNKAGRHANYGFDAVRNYYYVYLDFYSDFSASVDNMLNIRKEDGFGEAWVRIIKDGAEQPVEVAVKNEVPRPPKAKIEEEVIKPAEAKEVVERKEEKEAAAPKVLVINEQTPATIVTEVVENPKADPIYIPQTLKNTQAFFSLYNAANGRVVDGEVEVVDTDRARLLSKMKANSYLTLPDPKSKSGKLTLIGSAFGFRKIQHEMNYYNTEADTLQEDIDLIGNFYMVKFDLSRLVKGDIATLYNVYFYNDAAVMLPESKYELNKLLQMMQENPDYKVMLHGHTNGNGRGKIIYMGSEKDFFNITKDDIVNESGSAKELSGARAQVIKDWLTTQGIDASRIQVKAWGGGRMLHDKESQYARRNVRVEVEVLQN